MTTIITTYQTSIMNNTIPLESHRPQNANYEFSTILLHIHRLELNLLLLSSSTQTPRPSEPQDVPPTTLRNPLTLHPPH